MHRNVSTVNLPEITQGGDFTQSEPDQTKAFNIKKVAFTPLFNDHLCLY